MRPTSRVRGWLGCVIFLCGFAIAFTAPAAAQQTTSVPLVLQDFSDCTNANVSDPNGLLTRGTVWITRNTDGTTTLKIGITLVPNTVYHFFLKCVRILGDIKTGDEGIGEAMFTFPTNSTGNIYAFDVYPEGAPAGNKMQSMQVRF